MLQDIMNRISNVGAASTDALEHFGHLSQAHLQLLEVELRHQKDRAVTGTLLFTVAAVAGLTSLILLSAAAAAVLVSQGILPPSAAAGLVGAVWLIAAAGFAFAGYKIFRNLSLIPSRTIASLKESIQCVKQIH